MIDQVITRMNEFVVRDDVHDEAKKAVLFFKGMLESTIDENIIKAKFGEISTAMSEVAEGLQKADQVVLENVKKLEHRVGTLEAWAESQSKAAAAAEKARREQEISGAFQAAQQQTGG